MIGRRYVGGALVAAIMVAGCVTSSTLAPDQPVWNADRAITVYLRDGRAVRLEPGSYTVTPADSGRITGRGRLLASTGPGEPGSTWAGSVTLAEIDHIVTTEDTIVGSVSSAVFLVTLASLVGLLVLVAAVSMH